VSADPRSAPLLAELAELVAVDDVERADVSAIAALLSSSERPFDQAGRDHVTASAFVVSALGVVLLRHRLLGIWVQPGGHVELDEAPHDAAARETREETGLKVDHLDPPRLVHVNVHPGPRGHHHFDCRWLLEARTTALRPDAGETEEVGWFEPAAAIDRCEPGLRAGLGKALELARGLTLESVASWQR
jgi:8-oxo-dGTP pyrophosphatase MutT (NUDIX family)